MKNANINIFHAMFHGVQNENRCDPLDMKLYQRTRDQEKESKHS